MHDWQVVGVANGTRHYRCSRCRQDRLSGQRTTKLPTGPCSGAAGLAPAPKDDGPAKPSVA